jgi:hypothetical protein
MPDLDFATHNTLYATHGLHAYAAKCPPQLVGYGLRYYTKPGETVLDPMTGSGTTAFKTAYGRVISYSCMQIRVAICRVLMSVPPAVAGWWW